MDCIVAVAARDLLVQTPLNCLQLHQLFKKRLDLKNGILASELGVQCLRAHALVTAVMQAAVQCVQDLKPLLPYQRFVDFYVRFSKQYIHGRCLGSN